MLFFGFSYDQVTTFGLAHWGVSISSPLGLHSVLSKRKKKLNMFPFFASINHHTPPMTICLRYTPPSQFLPTRIHNFRRLFPPNVRHHSWRIKTRALTEWREYEEAVKDKDLGKALGFLQQIEIQYSINDLELQRDWQVLDTCLNADDIRLVASAYSYLKDKGFLIHFGKYRSIGNYFLNLLLYTKLHLSINILNWITCCVFANYSFGGNKRCYSNCFNVFYWFTRYAFRYNCGNLLWY